MKQYFHHLCIYKFGMLARCMHIAHTIKESKCTPVILNGDFTESSRLLSLLNSVSLDIELDLVKYFILSSVATNVSVCSCSVAAYIVRI